MEFSRAASAVSALLTLRLKGGETSAERERRRKLARDDGLIF